MDGFIPFGERDDWTVTDRGQVVIVRGLEYKAEWLGGDGAVRHSVPISSARVDVTAEEKEAWWRAAQTDSIVMMDCRSRPCKPVNVFRAARPTEWPKVKSPFEYLSLRVDPNGDLWIRRTGAIHDSHVCYDVVSETGGVRHVLLPLERTVMAFGPGAVFARAEDPDGLQFVEEYRFPR